MRKALHICAMLSYAAIGASFTAPAVAVPVDIKIGVSDNLGSRITRILEQHPDVCAQDGFFSDQWLRTSLEFVIVCRAIRLGGLEATYSILSFPNSARTRAELLEGTVAIMVDLPWGDFAGHEDLYRSDAVLRIGDFVKGVYTRPDHSALLKVSKVEDLRTFKAVSSKTWVYDWAALQRMKIQTFSVTRYELMGSMVERGRADFLIAEFPGAADLSQYINGFRFIPVPGVKVALPGSRHVAVSKRAPHAKAIFDALQIGLKLMHERGQIKKGYQAAGFLNPLIDEWKVLCCEEE